MNSIGLPKIPTDSFYKCAMFLGILIVLASSVTPTSYYFFELDKRKSQCSSTIKLLEKKKEHLSGELDVLVFESEELTNKIKEKFKDTTFPKGIDRSKAQKSEIVKANLDYVKEKVTFYKPQFDVSEVGFVFPGKRFNTSASGYSPNDDSIEFPPTAVNTTRLEDRQGLALLTLIENTVNDIESRLSKNLQEQHEREYESIQVNEENERLLGLADNMKSKPFLISCVIICALGVFMAFWGGKNWLKREQKLQDKILEINAKVVSTTKQQERQKKAGEL
ncbi:MAG: hypothetical protein ABSG99_09325 [Sedimentisphaerales bacterium]